MRAFVEAMPPHTDLLMAELNYLEAHPPPSCQHGVAVDVLDAEKLERVIAVGHDWSVTSQTSSSRTS